MKHLKYCIVMAGLMAGLVGTFKAQADTQISYRVGNQVDWSSIINDTRYDIEGPKIAFGSNGSSGSISARYTDVCIDGNEVKTVYNVCTKQDRIQIPGRGTDVGPCLARGDRTFSRPLTQESYGCVDRQWKKVRETSVGSQGQYDWVCVSEGTKLNSVPTSAKLTVKFYKHGIRTAGSGAPIAPTEQFQAEYTLPHCN